MSEGGLTATVTPLGQYLAGPPPTGNFTGAWTSFGGTLVTDPPTSATTDQHPLMLVNTPH